MTCRFVPIGTVQATSTFKHTDKHTDKPRHKPSPQAYTAAHIEMHACPQTGTQPNSHAAPLARGGVPIAHLAELPLPRYKGEKTVKSRPLPPPPPP